MIEVELPDGTIAEFPDGTARDIIKGALRRRFAPPQVAAPGKNDLPMSYGETAMDMAKSAGAGVGKGIIGAIGMPADIGQWLGRKATGAIDSAMGVPPEQTFKSQQAAGNIPFTMSPPRSDQVRAAVEKVTGPLYEPKTVSGRYADTVGQFAANAPFGGGGLIRKAVTTIVPAVASEYAGEKTEGTAFEPYARIGAAVLGNMGTNSRVPRMLGGKGTPIDQMIAAAPPAATVRAQKSNLYQALENAGVRYDANAYGQWANQLQSKLAKEGLDSTLHPRSTAVLKRVMDEVGTSPDFTKMETLRKIAGESVRGNAMTDAADINRSGVIMKEVDNFFANSPLTSNGSIPPGEVNAMARQARELARRNIVARDMQEMDRKSEYYLGGSESGKRNQAGSYMRSPKGKILTPAEEMAMSKVIRREGVENVLHNTGSRLAQIGTMATGVASIPITGAMGPIVGGAAILGNIGARKLMERITDKRMQDAIATALAGKAAQSKALGATQALKSDRLLQAILSAESARRSVQQQSYPGLLDDGRRNYPNSLLGD